MHGDLLGQWLGQRQDSSQGCLCAGELEDLGAAQPKVVEAAELEGSGCSPGQGSKVWKLPSLHWRLKKLETCRPISKGDGSNGHNRDCFFFFPFSFHPKYNPVGCCHPHLGWIFLSPFAGLHVSHPWTHPEPCFTNLLAIS